KKKKKNEANKTKQNTHSKLKNSPERTNRETPACSNGGFWEISEGKIRRELDFKLYNSHINYWKGIFGE
ncbi:hypothetical protein Csa_023748, partial [Cucumis sativus]